MTYHPVNNNTVNRPYHDRYKRDVGFFADKLFSAGPHIVSLASFGIALAGLLFLIAFDPVVGMYSAGYVAGPKVDWFVSGSTTGLVISLFGSAVYGWKQKWPWYIIAVLVGIGLIPAAIDVYFDGMAVDVIRFGHFIIPSQQFGAGSPDVMPHNLMRVMFGAMSTVGEPLAASAVIVFPIIKDLLRGVLASE